MKKLVHCSVVMVLIGLAGAGPLEAQDGGLGGFMDWILKMSGPRMIGPAASGWFSPGEGPLRIRGSIAWRESSSSDDAVSPAGSKIDMTSYQVALELPLPVPANWLALGGGIAVHRFGGDADAFTKVSIPVYAQARFPIIPLLIDGVVEFGFHYFSAFDDTDFAPLTVDVSRDGGEVVPRIGAGLEIVF